jgi:hypothetical protein
MIYYHNGERSDETRTRMIDDVQAVARLISSWELTYMEIDEILYQVRSELVLRYGQEAGPRINREFADAFEAAISLKISMRRSADRADTLPVAQAS